jgi:general secretion pathway protein K
MKYLLRNEQGMALIITLLVVSLLVVIVLEFNYLVQVEADVTANFRDGMKAYYLAKSGIHFAAALLRADNKNKYDALTEDWAKELPALPLGDGVVTVRITDEEGKFDLNHFVRQNNNTIDEKRVEILERLFAGLGLNPRLVDPLLDWVIPAEVQRLDLPTFNYQDKGYESKHGPLDLISELRLLQGFSNEVLLHLGGKPFGEGVDFLVSPYLTVFSQEGKINVNTASQEVLQSLSPEMTQGLAEEILLFREESPFQKKEDLQTVIPTVYNEIKDYIDVSSRYYTVVSTGTVGTITREIVAVLDKDKQQRKVSFLYWQAR